MPETNAPSPVPRVDRSLFDEPAADAPGVAVDPVTVDPAVEAPTEVIAAAPASRTRHRRSLSPRDVLLRRVARTAVPIVLVAGTLVACTTSSGPPAPPTARVERTSVTTAVSSSGSLTAVTEQNLGFLKGGQVKTVDVKVGQKVTAGEVLATVDDAPARHVLEQQQGQLASQQAALTRLVNATTVTGAQNTTNQAGEILDATQDQASAQVDADQSAVDRAKKQLDFDEDARDDIEDQLDQAEKRVRGVRRQPVERVGRHLGPAVGDPRAVRLRRRRQRRLRGGAQEAARGRAEGRGQPRRLARVVGRLRRRTPPAPRWPPCSRRRPRPSGR